MKLIMAYMHGDVTLAIAKVLKKMPGGWRHHKIDLDILLQLCCLKDN
jgi:hypothetical protein